MHAKNKMRMYVRELERSSESPTYLMFTMLNYGSLDSERIFVQEMPAASSAGSGSPKRKKAGGVPLPGHHPGPGPPQAGLFLLSGLGHCLSGGTTDLSEPEESRCANEPEKVFCSFFFPAGESQRLKRLSSQLSGKTPRLTASIGKPMVHHQRL